MQLEIDIYTIDTCLLFCFDILKITVPIVYQIIKYYTLFIYKLLCFFKLILLFVTSI